MDSENKNRSPSVKEQDTKLLSEISSSKKYEVEDGSDYSQISNENDPKNLTISSSRNLSKKIEGLEDNYKSQNILDLEMK